MKKSGSHSNDVLFIILLVLFIVTAVSQFVYTEHAIESKVNDLIDDNKNTNESIVLPNVNLDFQNKSGVARIKSTFTDILVGSDGSIKKGDGYKLKLNIINSSSITLRNITCLFAYKSSTEPVIYEDVNLIILPGKVKRVTCFISNLSDIDLKSVNVSVRFGQISYYHR